jgi:hypothetical protein
MRHAMKKDTGVRLKVLGAVVIEEDVRALRERDTAAKPEVIRRQRGRMPLAPAFPLEEAAQARAAIQAGHGRGKIVQMVA